MKKSVLAILFLFLFGAALQAQNIKIGYTNYEYILSLMPEAKQIDSDLKTYEKQLSTQLESKTGEFRQKVEAYQKGAATMTDVVRADKEEELQNLQASIEKFQREAQTSLQRKQVELLQPAYDKIQKAIDEVAKENGYTYVISSDVAGAPVLLYAPENEEGNISNLVLKKLGVTPPAKDAGSSNASPATGTNTGAAKPAVTTPNNKK